LVGSNDRVGSSEPEPPAGRGEREGKMGNGERGGEGEIQIGRRY